MRAIRCDKNKHYYDADIYDECPHCRKEELGGAQTGIRPPQLPFESSRLPDNNAGHGKAPQAKIKGPTPDNPISQNAPESNHDKPAMVFCTSCGKAIRSVQRFCTYCGAEQGNPAGLPEKEPSRQANPFVKAPEEGFTSSIWDQQQSRPASASGGTDDASPASAPGNRAYEPPVAISTEPQKASESMRDKPDEQGSPPVLYIPKPVSAEQKHGTERAEEDLRQAVAAVTSYSASEDAKTAAFYDLGVEESPAVGWIVCVKGEYMGQSFEIKSGQNYIGRAQNMNIALAREASVSRNRHAVIIFDPAKQAFYIQKGESSGLTYLNRELVMDHTMLNPYDKISIGNVEFVFVPFCGDRFSWDDYMK
jgi:hypothetical protein